MKTKVKNSEIIKFAKSHKASEFELWCNENFIDVVWLDVNISNFNEDFYNVELPEYNLCLLFCDGKFEEAQEL